MLLKDQSHLKIWIQTNFNCHPQIKLPSKKDTVASMITKNTKLMKPTVDFKYPSQQFREGKWKI